MGTYENEKTIEQIAATIAHEVKNPLSVVRANIDLLESMDKEKNHDQNYKVIYRGLDKINAMMMDFLQLLKTSDEIDDIVYLDEVINEIVNDYESTHKHIRFIKNLDPNISVLGDAKRLSIVFSNVIKNAVEAIESKDSLADINKIEIHAKEKGAELEITIIDNGVGITKETEDKIKREYYTTKKTGNGLGVHICRKIITDHRGEFEITKAENRGCKVSISLPKYE